MVQVRTVFRIQSTTQHPLSGIPLMYVLWYEKPSDPVQDINMYRLRMQVNDRGVPRGGVLPLALAHRFVQLIPSFDNVMAPHINSSNSAFVCKRYWVNSFADKEIYQAVW